MVFIVSDFLIMPLEDENGIIMHRGAPVSNKIILQILKKKQHFSFYKTCFDIPMSSSQLQMLDGCTFEFSK